MVCGIGMTPPPIHVLIVDDEPDLCELTRSFLDASGGMGVDTVCSVAEARIALGQKQYDAVISDYQMPIEDGIQFLKSLRNKGDRIPFILFTGKGREDVVIEALNHGADSYLQKGGKPAPLYVELEHRIRAAVQKHRSEEALRESENNLARAERVAGLGHWRLDMNTQIISGSEEALAICGLEERSMEYSEFRKVIVSDYVPLLNKSMKSLIEEGKPYDVEAKIRRKGDGEIIDIHSIAEYDREKRVVFGTLQDITRRKRAEMLLEENERRYRLIADNMADVVSVLDLDLHFTYLSPSIEELRGFTPEEVLRQSLDEVLTPGSAKLIRETLSAQKELAMSGKLDLESKLYLELEEYRKDGTTIWVGNNISYLRDEQGRPIAFIAVSQDITERNKAEAALRESEGRHRRISETTTDFVFSCVRPEGGEYAIDWMAGDVEGILGYSIEEMRSMRCWGPLVLPEDASIFQVNVADLPPGTSKDCVLRIRTKNGEVRWLAVNTTHPSSREDPSHDRVFGGCTDISEQMRSEATLQRQSAMLSLLNDIISTANKTEDLSQLLNDALAGALRLLDFDAGGIYLVDHSTRTANVVCSINLSPEFLVGTHGLSIDEEPYDTLFIKNEAIITDDYTQINPDRAKRFGFCSMASIPLTSKGVTIGALNVASMRRHMISEDEKQVLISICRELSSSIGRLESEKEAKKAAKNLEAIFHSIEEMVFVVDMQGHILAVNDAVQKRLSHTSEELVGTNVLLLHVPERRDEALQIVQGMIAGTASSCPVPIMAKDGTRIEVETRVTRGRWNGQEVLFGVSRDITERKRAQEMLMKDEERFHSLFNNHDSVMLLIEEESGAIVDANLSAQRFYGRDRESLCQLRIEDINMLPPEEVRELRAKAMRSQQNYFWLSLG